MSNKQEVSQGVVPGEPVSDKTLVDAEVFKPQPFLNPVVRLWRWFGVQIWNVGYAISERLKRSKDKPQDAPPDPVIQAGSANVVQLPMPKVTPMPPQDLKKDFLELEEKVVHLNRQLQEFRTERANAADKRPEGTLVVPRKLEQIQQEMDKLEKLKAEVQEQFQNTLGELAEHRRLAEEGKQSTKHTLEEVRKLYEEMVVSANMLKTYGENVKSHGESQLRLAKLLEEKIKQGQELEETLTVRIAEGHFQEKALLKLASVPVKPVPTLETAPTIEQPMVPEQQLAPAPQPAPALSLVPAVSPEKAPEPKPEPLSASQEVTVPGVAKVDPEELFNSGEHRVAQGNLEDADLYPPGLPPLITVEKLKQFYGDHKFGVWMAVLGSSACVYLVYILAFYPELPSNVWKLAFGSETPPAAQAGQQEAKLIQPPVEKAKNAPNPPAKKPGQSPPKAEPKPEPKPEIKQVPKAPKAAAPTAPAQKQSEPKQLQDQAYANKVQNVLQRAMVEIGDDDGEDEYPKQPLTKLPAIKPLKETLGQPAHTKSATPSIEVAADVREQKPIQRRKRVCGADADGTSSCSYVPVQ